MKKLFSILTLCMGLCFVSCYDDSELVERIDALEQSTIASLKASISSLETQSTEIKASITSLEQSGNANAANISNLKTSLSTIESKITELKDWVEKLLEGYYSKDEIDAQISSLNTELETLRTSISSIESKLAILTREFSITFDDTDIGILAGGTASVGYSIIGATDITTVKAFGQNGWSAKVTPDGTDKGKITVTAPNPLTEDEIIVLVYDGEYRTIMSSINFVTGVVTPSQPGVELEAEAGNIDIKVASNLNYKVSVSQDAMDWLSVVETKSIKESIVTLAYTANRGNLRQGYIYFTDSSGKLISSLLIMQAGISNIVIPVSSVNLNLYSVTLYVGYGAQLTASVMPKDATDKSVIWSSDAPNVAIVDERGLITAVAPGIANITATSGDVYATCSVTVLDIKVLNYIDEYGIDHGKGVVIGNAIWAPVNCGYHSDYYKYGKLYQWGRMYGQGYDKSDASSPIIEEGGVSVISGNDSNNANVFYTGIYNNDNSWVYPGSVTYWKLRDNNDQPIKAEYDPCPAGWRIPSDNELYDLITNHSDISTDKNGHSGYWFSGPNVYSSYVPQIFLPLAGNRSCTGENMGRELMGVYWSTAYKSRVLYMLESNYIRIEYDYHAGKWANGNSVRCVQE